MAKMKYRVVEGKHQVGVGPEGAQYARKGEILEMSPEEAAKFPGKFAPVLEQAQAKPTETKPTETKTADDGKDGKDGKDGGQASQGANQGGKK